MKQGFLTQGFMVMIYAILTVVLLSAMFTPIMTALAALAATAGVSTFIAFSTVITIIPTVLLLGLTIGAGIFYYKGYKQTASNDPGGMLRLVLGVLQVILFITMFATVVTNFYSLYTTYGTCTTWIAFGVVIKIIPTILFLAGIFSGGIVAFQGGKAAAAHRKGSEASE
jgi:hypothetical protein